MSTPADTPSTPSRSRKGPTRSEVSKAAILEAARDEMAENGWRSFSVDSVAKRASASKQTIYRWWPSIGAMCVDAALALIPDAPEGGRDPQERITALIIPLEAAARTGHGHAVAHALGGTGGKTRDPARFRAGRCFGAAFRPHFPPADDFAGAGEGRLLRRTGNGVPAHLRAVLRTLFPRALAPDPMASSRNSDVACVRKCRAGR